jgi:hypothetical protein
LLKIEIINILWLASGGHLDILKWLVSQGSDIDAADEVKPIKLFIFCDFNSFFILEWLDFTSYS